MIGLVMAVALGGLCFHRGDAYRIGHVSIAASDREVVENAFCQGPAATPERVRVAQIDCDQDGALSRADGANLVCVEWLAEAEDRSSFLAGPQVGEDPLSVELNPCAVGRHAPASDVLIAKDNAPRWRLASVRYDNRDLKRLSYTEVFSRDFLNDQVRPELALRRVLGDDRDGVRAVRRSTGLLEGDVDQNNPDGTQYRLNAGGPEHRLSPPRHALLSMQIALFAIGIGFAVLGFKCAGYAAQVRRDVHILTGAAVSLSGGGLASFALTWLLSRGA